MVHIIKPITRATVKKALRFKQKPFKPVKFLGLRASKGKVVSLTSSIKTTVQKKAKQAKLGRSLSAVHTRKSLRWTARKVLQEFEKAVLGSTTVIEVAEEPKKLKGSWIMALKYIPEKRRICADLNGRFYTIYNVNKNIYDAWVSRRIYLGVFFHLNIKNKYLIKQGWNEW